jgi:hypothetical protein
VQLSGSQENWKKNEFVLGMGSVGKCFLTKLINGVEERMSD